MKLSDCKSVECGGPLFAHIQYLDRDFYLEEILREKECGKTIFFEYDQSGLTDEFFSQMVYPGYLETLNKETDAGPLLAFRSNLMRFDSTVMFCKVAIIALYRLFSLVEQVVIGPARKSPGGKSCSIILDKPIWLYPLSLWLLSNGAETETLSRSSRGAFRYKLKFSDSNTWAVFVRTSCIGHLIEWSDDNLGATSKVHVSPEHPVSFTYKKTHLHVSFALETKANKNADIEIRGETDGTANIFAFMKKTAI